ncbi:extracellular solute-binding protein [Ruminococcus flavefaciens]|uniref:Putative aldouronate transport system substrate-binding protein n=1 Tax=Ruminococcus flavefaciens TaxID=1265 RepID=A0A1K1PPM8_RUMFL|nr:extracellular solute-binding protein [Ruminococcus flavefaciens]SFW49666.1 putative aldouronate transport system substrate-binding protein [Ruminococcus flavefaciens]
MTIRKMTAAFLAAAMTLSVSGCGKNKPQENNIKEFTGIFAARSTEIDRDNEIQQIIGEKTGVILRQSWISDQDDIDKTFSDMMISNKYPDFMTPDAENCQKLIKEGAFIPIDSYWDQYPRIKNMYTEREWDSVRADDGHVYYIPLFSSINIKDTNPIHSGEAFWIQVKVLEWAGYPDIKTPYEYFDLIERYLEANPTNENGEAYYGYEIEANDAWFFALDNPPMFLDGYPNDGCCIVDTETLEAKDYNLTPTAKAWYKLLNEEYKKGIIDKEFSMLSSEQYYSRLASGRVLGMIDQNWNFSSSVNKLSPDCTYIPLGITMDRSIPDRYRDRVAFNGSAGVGVSISCDDPEAAIKFISDLLTPEILNLRFWGVEGVDYSVDKDGIFYQTDEQYAQWRNEEYRRKHICVYNYMPYYLGMAPDGINAFESTNQPNIFYEHLSDDVQRCFSAYGIQTYTEMLNDPPENSPWYPMWSFSNSVTDETDYGKVMKQIDAAKHKYLPLLVMSNDFESSWEEYVDEYNQIDSQIYFDELTAEVRRRAAQ